MKRALTLSVGGLLYSIVPSAFAAEPIAPCVVDSKTGACIAEKIPDKPAPRISITVDQITANNNNKSSVSTTRIDVLVAYTTAAKNELANHPFMQTNPGTCASTALACRMREKIRWAISSANDAYANSNWLSGDPIRQTLCLIGTQEIPPNPYIENPSSNPEEALAALKADLEVVNNHANSIRGNADIVVLFRKGTNGTPCGVSNQMKNEFTNNPTFQDSAFSVVTMSSSTTPDCVANYTFVHELGHLMGAGHAKETETGAFPYSRAYAYPIPESPTLNQRRPSSVMTVPNDPNCTVGIGINSIICERYNVFSQYQPFQFGNTPSDEKNNALTLNNTSDVISNFRANTSEQCDNGKTIITLPQPSLKTVSTQPQNFTIYNNGTTSLTITEIKPSNADWITSISFTNKELIIPAGGSSTINFSINFKNIPIGSSKASLQIVSNATNIKVLELPIIIEKEDDSLPLTDSTQFANFDPSTGIFHLHTNISGTKISYQNKFELVKHSSKPDAKLFKLTNSFQVRNHPNFTVAKYYPDKRTIEIPALSTKTKFLPQYTYAKLRLLPELNLFEMSDVLELQVEMIE